MHRSMTNLLCASLVALAVAAPTIAGAADNRLTLVIGGEAYDGPPRFEVSFGGKVIGEGVLDAAIDTGSQGRFATAADRVAHVQSFDFAVPEDVFSPQGEVRVRLLNEAFGGEGSDRDRNLFLASVAVNGRTVTLSGLSAASPSGEASRQTLDEFLILPDGTLEGVSAAPASGWPTAAPAPASGIATVLTGARDTSSGVAWAGGEGADKGAVDTRVETASIGPAEDVSGCARKPVYNVVGFNENSNDLTPRLMERLDQIAIDLGESSCTVRVTGYSSTQGDFATNALFAVERAQNVLNYLRAKGIRFEDVTATGAGETDQFGPTFSANRRVVITVAP